MFGHISLKPAQKPNANYVESKYLELRVQQQACGNIYNQFIRIYTRYWKEEPHAQKERAKYLQFSLLNYLYKKLKFKQTKIEQFAKTRINEKDVAEEQLVRIMLRQNNAFTFFDDPDVKILIAKSYPNVQVNRRS